MSTDAMRAPAGRPRSAFVCLIDFDDTLVDYRAEERAAVDAVTERLGERRPGLDPGAIRDAYTLAKRQGRSRSASRPDGLPPGWARLREMLALAGATPEPDLVDELLAVYWATRLVGVRPFPEARALLELLHSSSDIVLCTDGPPQYQRQRVERSGLHHFFADIRISGELGVDKTDLRSHAGPCLVTHRPWIMISDRLEPDLRAAARLGIPGLWLNHAQDRAHAAGSGGHGVWAAVSDLGALIAVLNRLLGG
jgi:FMN phosphatase YigB (HAD superfamily)